MRIWRSNWINKIENFLAPPLRQQTSVEIVSNHANLRHSPRNPRIDASKHLSFLVPNGATSFAGSQNILFSGSNWLILAHPRGRLAEVVPPSFQVSPGQQNVSAKPIFSVLPLSKSREVVGSEGSNELQTFSFAVGNVLEKPRPAVGPMSFGGCSRNAERCGGLFNGQSSEVAEFD